MYNNPSYCMYELQMSRERQSLMNDANKAKAALENLYETGREHYTPYAGELIDSLKPLITNALSEMDTMNPFFIERIKPFIADDENKELIVNHFVLHLIHTFSREVMLIQLVSDLGKELVRQVGVACEDSASLYEEYAASFAHDVVSHALAHSEIFDVSRDSTKAPYSIRPSIPWVVRIGEAFDDITISKYTYEPMVCKPDPRSTLLEDDGGYLSIYSPLMKRGVYIDGELAPEFKRFNKRTGKMFFKIINEVEATPYQVNADIIRIVEDWNARGTAKDSNGVTRPLTYSKFLTSNCDKELSIALATDSAEKRIEANTNQYGNTSEKFAKRIRKEEAVKVRDKIANTDKLLELAKEYSNFDSIYYPVYCDSRPRRYTYVDTGSLTYMGSELAKALIGHACKERLTERGLTSLYETLGTSLDVGKFSFKSRIKRAKAWFEAFKEEFMNGNFDAVMTDGFEKVNEETGEITFIRTADEPYLVLAMVVELANYYKDPENYETGIICHRDARCSGASIIGTSYSDTQIMKLTSVMDIVMHAEDVKLPDAYQFVADIAREMNKDSKHGDEYFEANSDILFHRSTWKTAVMTRSSYGASMQTIKQGTGKEAGGLKKIFIENNLDLRYLEKFTKLMKDALDTSLPSCAMYLDSIQRASRGFIEQNGYFKVLQPFTKFPFITISNTYSDVRLESKSGYKEISLVYRRWNRNELDMNAMIRAVGPNVIHSFDCSLLFRVQELCPSFYITTIHDSIGAHPNNVHHVVKAYGQAMFELNTMGAMASIFEQLGSPELFTPLKATTEELEIIKESIHVLS